ncbi:hypothetical protein PMAYCL1PPCAC_16759, partial [Pristionchus mayeri]
SYCWNETPAVAHDWSLILFGIVPFRIILTLCVFFMFWSRKPVGSRVVSEPGVSELLFQLDTIFCAFFGIALMAFPRWILEEQMGGTVDASHEHICRVIGLYFLTSVCFGVNSVHWTSVDDRRAVVESRAIALVGIMLVEHLSPLPFWNSSWQIGSTLFTVWTAMSTVHLLMHPMSSFRSHKANDEASKSQEIHLRAG